MVRTDKPMPHVRGVADYQNYGDEPGARALLNPPSYSELGVEPADFATPLPLPALVNIFARAGLAEALTQLVRCHWLAPNSDSPSLATFPGHALSGGRCRAGLPRGGRRRAGSVGH